MKRTATVLLAIFMCLTSVQSGYACNSEEARDKLETALLSGETDIVIDCEENVLKGTLSMDSSRNIRPENADSRGDYLREGAIKDITAYDPTYINGVYSRRYKATQRFTKDEIALIKSFVDSVQVEGDAEAEKVVSITEILCKKLRYKADADILSAATKGEGSCAAYAQLFYLIAKNCNIEVRIVRGYVENDSKTICHEWCIAKIKDKWYHCDPTISDTKGDVERWTLKGSNVFSKTHQVKDKYDTTEFRKACPIAKGDCSQEMTCRFTKAQLPRARGLLLASQTV